MSASMGLEWRKAQKTRKSPRFDLGEPRDEADTSIHSTKRRNSQDHDASGSRSTAARKEITAPKRRKKFSSQKKEGNGDLYERLFGLSGTSRYQPCLPPARHHSVTYHRPLLIDDLDSRHALLYWFSTVNKKRAMPWRKGWICPEMHDDANEVRKLLERRAYEVWISEIMLQQTRVAVVIEYWNRWMAKWPTIHLLAAAESDEVLNAWRGLGYYSRATRIHEAAKLVTRDSTMRGLLPSDPKELEAKIPGVGRYTAGAISAIVFGQPVPMVDGNVLRVLSRQLGLYGNTKTDKAIIDMMWAAAAALVKAVMLDPSINQDNEQEPASNGDRPGAWGQALMELGSTVCTPKPNCMECPVNSTCRAYAEGKLLAHMEQDSSTCLERNELGDIEDLCHLCESFQMHEDDNSSETTYKATTPNLKTTSKTITTTRTQPEKTFLSSHFSKGLSQDNLAASKRLEMDSIVDHARRFPLKVTKKAVKIQECLVCIVRRDDGHYLIQKRPEKGLLANLWEFPSKLLSESEYGQSPAKHRAKVVSFMSSLVRSQAPNVTRLKYVCYLNSIPWLFSHIKLTMHVHLLAVKKCPGDPSTNPTFKWATDELVEQESMGTGMRKCWTLMKQSRNEGSGADDSDP